MNNRKRIKKALEQSGYTPISIEFHKETEYIYGDYSNASYWFIQTEEGESFDSSLGDTVDQGVDIMIEEIKASKLIEENKIKAPTSGEGFAVRHSSEK